MKIELNHLFTALRGNMDGIIYKRFEGRTIAVPKPQYARPATAAQLRARERFTAAVAYAQAVLADPARRGIYLAVAQERGRQSPAAVAMADYLNPPVVHAIDLSAYQGRAGDPIAITASDDVEVVSVKVTIRSAAGDMIEAGWATPGGARWIYGGRTAVVLKEGLLIEAAAADRTRNESALSASWRA